MAEMSSTSTGGTGAVFSKDSSIIAVSEDGTILRLRKIPFHRRLLYRVEDFIDDVNWLHIAFKICAFSYLLLLSLIAWQVLPLPGHWSRGTEVETTKLRIPYQDFAT
jgi:hypothetical protein